MQGGAEQSGNCTQRSYPLVLEAESDQLCVPAELCLNCWTSCLFQFLQSVLVNGKGLSQVPQHQFFIFTHFTRSPQSEQSFLESIFMIADPSPIYWLGHLRRFRRRRQQIWFMNIFNLSYSLWCRFWTWWSLRRTSIIRRNRRRLICFPSNLHVTGFSSCRIIWSILI